ncbi:MAG: helix-turn-helix domain-containing protein, partial [Syntrophothermus sp.]
MSNTNTISETEKNQLIKEILASPGFKDSNRYHDLLLYLIEASVKGEAVKETTLAHELFGKDSKFDPGEDPSVRVYVSNLRKKLEHYFLTSEEKHFYRLEIPKGQYTVQFVPAPVKQDIKSPEKPSYIVQILSGTIVFLISVIIILLLMRPSQNIQPDKVTASNPVWAEFMQPNNKPTIIVLGDFLFLFEKKNSPSGGNFVRDARINSEEDFRNMLKQNPNMINQFVILNFTYLRPSASWGLSEVLPVLWHSPNKIFLKLSSQLKWEDFQNHNIVFIGTFKTLYKLGQLLPAFNIKYNAA